MLARTVRGLAVGAIMAAGALLVPVSASAASAPAAVIPFANCTALRKTFPHGAARPGAVDRVHGRSKPIRTFAVNATVYNANNRLDADHDGVACEK